MPAAPTDTLSQVFREVAVRDATAKDATASMSGKQKLIRAGNEKTRWNDGLILDPDLHHGNLVG